MCFSKSHQSKNTESILVTFFPPQTEPLVLPHRHPEVNRQPGDFLFWSWFPPSAALRLEQWPRRETKPIWRASARHFAPSGCFSTVWTIIKPSCCCCSSDESRGSDFLLDISVFMSRVCFDVCLMEVDAKWKTKRKVFFFCCKYNLFSCGCPGLSLPSCDWTKVKSSRSLFRHSGRVPHSRFTSVMVEVIGKVWRCENTRSCSEGIGYFKHILYEHRDDVE